MSRGLPLPGTPAFPLVLSPMVDVTDAAFRSLAREHGADVTCSEMIAAAGLVHDRARAWRDAEPWPGESPYGVQFMTADPDELRNAIRDLAERVKVDFIDLNMGCPAPNILRSCAGGFLMRDPKQAARVVKAGVAAAEEAGIKRVSVKLRLGPDAKRLTYVEVAQEAEAAGAAWATLHARTVEQGYAGNAEWEHIAKLVEAVEIPILGNGDVRTPGDAVRMRNETGCAGLFIARAAMRDPTILGRMRKALDGKDAGPEPGASARRAVLCDYLDRAAKRGDVTIAFLRRQASRLISGTPGSARLRMRIQSCKSMDELRAAVAAASV